MLSVASYPVFDLSVGPSAHRRQLSPRTGNFYKLQVLRAGIFLSSLTAFIMQAVFLTDQIRYKQHIVRLFCQLTQQIFISNSIFTTESHLHPHVMFLLISAGEYYIGIYDFRQRKLAKNVCLSLIHFFSFIPLFASKAFDTI